MTSPYQHINLVADDEPAYGTYYVGLAQSIVLKLGSIPPFYRGSFRRPLANFIRNLGKNGIVDIERNQAHYRLRKSPNLIEDAILVHKNYNRRELDFLIQGTPIGGTFLDLGSNVGLYSLPLAIKAGPNGRVLSIDANPDIMKALAFNISASQLTNIDIACVAVGETDKQVRLEIRKDDYAIVETHEDPNGTISMRPLADIVAHFGITSIDTLKADIEGYEDRALIPFLSNATPDLIPNRIVIEHAAHYEWETDLCDWLTRFGYHLIAKQRSNSLYNFGTSQL